MSNSIDPESLEDLKERVVHINRVAKVVKGGRRFSFSALVVVGDEKGHVGIGLGKANEVPDAIRKGHDRAKKNLFKIPLVGGTIPHIVQGHAARATSCSARPALEPASSRAARCAPSSRPRASSDVLSKIVGTSNPHNVVHATIDALRSTRVG
jgi:small subunit ribosomal protein S5